MIHFFSVVVIVHALAKVSGIALMVDPPMRSSMHRYGFPSATPNDVVVNCGGDVSCETYSYYLHTPYLY